MTEPSLRLVEPNEGLRDAFLEMARDWQQAGEDRYAAALEDFPAYLRRLRDYARGIGLKPGHVPETTYWLLRGEETIVGVGRLRHRLTLALRELGGHIGYDIRPSERRKGYGTALLGLTLREARARGLRRVLLTCDDDNVASARIIEKNGGVLADRVRPAGHDELWRRYWIDLGADQ